MNIIWQSKLAFCLWRRPRSIRSLYFKRHITKFRYQYSPERFIAYHYRKKRSPVILEALHGFNSKGFSKSAEIMTAPMAHYIGYLLKSPTILALHSRNYCDLNRRATAQKTVDGVLNTQIQKAAKKEYTSILTAILNEYTTLGVLNRPVLILSIHGMKDRLNRGIDIGSGMGKSANLEVAGWFQNALSQALLKQGIKTKIHLDDGFTGANQLKILRKPEYFGSNLHILQIEISRDLRINYFFQLTLILAQILKNFEKQDWTKISKLDNDIEELKLEIRIATNLSVKEVEMDASQRRRLKIKKNEQIELFAGTRKLGVFNVVAVERSRIGSGQVGVSENLMKHFGLVNKQILTLKKPNF